MLELTIINCVASALFLTGIVNVSDAPGFYVTFPLAAILYGMFLICRMLQKDVVEFDAEHHHQHAAEHHAEPAKMLHGHEHHAPAKA